jgi:O-antigen/teichoic acid export membrane protein
VLAQPPELASALFGVALALPLILLSWLLRRAFYICEKSHLSAASGVLYLVITMVGIAALNAAHQLSTFGALATMAFAGFIVCAWMLVLLKPAPFKNFTARQVLTEHWQYGRWASGATGLAWTTEEFYYVLVPVVAGLPASATLRTLINLVLPLVQASSAVQNYLVPRYAHAYYQGNTTTIDKTFRWGLFTLVVGGVCYLLVLVLVGERMVQWLYNMKYSLTLPQLVLTGLIPISAAIKYAYNALLRSSGQVNKVFRVQALTTLISLPIGMLVMVIAGSTGALMAILVGFSLSALLMFRINGNAHHDHAA